MINRQLDARGLIVRQGTLIDATLLQASLKPPSVKEGTASGRDPEAGWTQKNGKTRFGYKAHVAVDEGSEIIRTALLTSADLHDSQPAAELIQGDEQAVYGDKAYASQGLQGLRARLAEAGRGGPQQAAEAVAELVQQGGRRDPCRRRAPLRDHETRLRLPPRPLHWACPQRLPSAPGVHCHQP